MNHPRHNHNTKKRTIKDKMQSSHPAQAQGSPYLIILPARHGAGSYARMAGTRICAIVSTRFPHVGVQMQAPAQCRCNPPRSPPPYAFVLAMLGVSKDFCSPSDLTPGNS